jgi:hypothetical protein
MPPQIERGIPQNLVFAGIVVGLFLALGGVSLSFLGSNVLLSSLMTCVGFGIVLVTFGSKAGGTWAGWSATGAGAMAIVLFLLLEHYTPSPEIFYKKGQLRGELSRIADLRIIDETPMYEFRDRTTSSIRFVLLQRKLKSERMSIQVDTNEKGDGREFFELIGNSKEIQQKYLSGGPDDDSVIQWNFYYDNRIVKDGDPVIFSEPSRLLGNIPAIPPAIPTSNRSSLLEFVIPFDVAIAGEAQIVDADVTSLLLKLKDNDAAVRRNARDQLAASGPSAVSTMMSALQSEPSNYRTKLGVVYALSEMLRQNPNQRSAISNALKESDFPLLVNAASDDDKTIRYQAAEFLATLQDPRAIPVSAKASRAANQNDKANNQLIILRESGHLLPDSEKKQILNDITTGPEPNNDLVGDTGYVKKTLKW